MSVMIETPGSGAVGDRRRREWSASPGRLRPRNMRGGPR